MLYMIELHHGNVMEDKHLVFDLQGQSLTEFADITLQMKSGKEIHAINTMDGGDDHFKGPPV